MKPALLCLVAALAGSALAAAAPQKPNFIYFLVDGTYASGPSAAVLPPARSRDRQGRRPGRTILSGARQKETKDSAQCAVAPLSARPSRGFKLPLCLLDHSISAAAASDASRLLPPGTAASAWILCFVALFTYTFPFFFALHFGLYALACLSPTVSSSPLLHTEGQPADAPRSSRAPLLPLPPPNRPRSRLERLCGRGR